MTSSSGNQVYTQGTGTASTNQFVTVLSTTNPSTSSINYPVGKRWVNTNTKTEFILASLESANGQLSANWIELGGGSAGTETLTGNSGGPVGPDGSNNINTVGDSTTINTIGNPGTHTLTSSVILPAQYDVLISNTSSIAGAAPSSTSGVPLVSNGPSSLAGFGVAVVQGGGTGVNSFTAYTPICGGTAAFLPLQSVASIGTAGQVLTSNGAGMLPTFQTGGGGSTFSMNVQVFTLVGTQTYTPTTNMAYCIVEVLGGGGQGGGYSVSGSTYETTGGGGAGGYSWALFSASAIGVSQTLTVGGGGTGGSSTGGTGGTSSFGSGPLMQATGGAGGTSSSNASFVVTLGGLGGVGSLGDVNATGSPGSIGFGGSNGPTIFSGAGGSSFYGAGGSSSILNTGSQNITGHAGSGYGAGGSGGCATSGVIATANGGVGSAGIIIVTEFIT